MVVAVGFQAALVVASVPPLWSTFAFLTSTTAWPGAAASPGDVGAKMVSLRTLAAWLLPVAGLVVVFTTVQAARCLMLLGIAGLSVRAVYLRRYQRASLRLL